MHYVVTDTMTVIRTEGLTRNYGNFRAVDHLDMEIEEGVCVGFLGPNGAGKSTTIKMLTTLLRPSEGKAYIHGHDVQTDGKKALSDVGAVVETPEFYPYLTPEESLTYLGRLRGMPGPELKKRIDEVLELVKMEEWRDKRIGTFSKGMKQRLAIAQAIMHDPSLIILDEPTSGLDPRGMVEVRDIIRRLKGEGKTIFMSSHLLNEVQEVADTVIMIERGKVILHDRVDALAKYSKSRRIEIQFLTPQTPATTDILKGMAGVKSVEWFGNTVCQITIEGGVEAQRELLAEAVKKGLDVVSFRESGMPLENLYMDLIKDSR